MILPFLLYRFDKFDRGEAPGLGLDDLFGIAAAFCDKVLSGN
jgi:hypothetical protein